MARIALVVAMMAAPLLACAGEAEDASAPLIPSAVALDVTPTDTHGAVPAGSYRVDAVTTCAVVAPTFRGSQTATITRDAARAELPVPWADRQTFDLTRPRSAYAVTDVTASCAAGWLERATELEVVGTTTLRATFREVEVGCGDAAPACETSATFTLESQYVR